MDEINALLDELEYSENKSEIYFEISLIYFNHGKLRSCLDALLSVIRYDELGLLKPNVIELIEYILPYINDDYEIEEKKVIEIDRSVTFDDVGGLKDVKKAIEMKIIKPFKHPELFKKFLKKSGGGVILYGPPGCGKTFLAKATAGECEAQFINVSISDILDPYIGVSERNIKAIFEQARQSKPCVLFFDEIDSLGYKRSRLRGEHLRTVIDEFLVQLQGFSTDNEGVLVIGATNTPWDVDEAFMRPGRFDKLLFVTPPDLEARMEIFRLKLRGLNIENMDYEKLATLTPLYSGADIQNVVEVASELAITDILETGIEREMGMDDLIAAINQTMPSTKEWINTVKNFIKFSNHSLYNEVKEFIKKNKL